MDSMFLGTNIFNQNISGWDVSGVTDMGWMFRDAGSFNQPLNDWNVSGVTDMNSMFHGADSFQQNLGKWYVNLDSTEISSAPGIVGGISAQNQELRDQYPKYGIGAGFDELAFEITVDDEDESSLNMTVSPDKRLYRVNVTSEGDFSTNNHRVYNVTVTSNFPPTVNAGQDQEVAEGATVSLSGTATDDDTEDTLAYSWTHDDSLAITITDSDSLSASFTAPGVAANTTITVTLTVNDGTVDVTDTLRVTITDSPNSPPEVGAGDDQEVVEGATVSLSGTATDDDTEDTLAYSWTHDDSLAITITDSDSLSASFTAPGVAANTTITVTLTVNDGTVDVTDTLRVTITDSPNSPPEVGAGDDQEVVEGATVSLSGTATDDDTEDTLAYSWTHDDSLAITITDSDSLSASFTAPGVAANTTITVTLTVNDGTVDVTDTLRVTITDSPNSPPEVGAGDDQEVVEGATVTLSGTATDDDTEDTLAYSWTHDDSLAITITDSDSLSASFTAPGVAANTTITVTLTVNDGTVDVTDTLRVTITDSPNSPPEVGAGDDQEGRRGRHGDPLWNGD